uniref:Hypoxia-inducible factor 1 n=1 Tax=Leptosynapta clarki TaxID=747474 RepID=A0AA96HC86_9ECHN|nr:hypoxia-inducible factor 1 [Leptosynapta clarki]
MSTSSKDRRRNSEKRKEKSRNAARCRRGKETEIFYELSHLLPLPHTVCSTLDKAGIMRIALGYLKIRKLLQGEKGKEEKENIKDLDEKQLTFQKIVDTYYPKALEGFLLVLSREGDIIYISENVSKYLGLSQIDLLGQSIYEFAHPCDHDEIKEQLSDRPGLNYITAKPEREHHSFWMRLKCTVTAKGKNVNLKSATYKVIQCTGHIRLSESESTAHGYRKPPVPCMVMIGSPIPHPSNIETPLDSKTFLTRHSMDMKFTDCDERIEELIGYAPDDLVGRSFYDFHHALDGSLIERSHRNLFSKGQTSTGQYRFLAKKGGYVWLETQATVISNNKTNKPECVVCVNYVLSGTENGDVPISIDQYQGDVGGVQMSTEKVFAPRMANMTSDFPVWLSGEDESTSEGDLLQYLAPTAGDTMIPLDFSSVTEKKEEESKVSSETYVPFNPFSRPEKGGEAGTETFIPYEPFGRQVDATKVNKPLFSSGPVMFGQPQAMVDIPPKELDLVDKNSPLNSSRDPLLTNQPEPDLTQNPAKKQICNLLPDDDDLLSMYAPFIPMGEEMDLMPDVLANTDPSETWQPADPFSLVLGSDVTPFGSKNQDQTSQFSTLTAPGQARSPPALISSPELSDPASPFSGSSFGDSMPDLCSVSSFGFSPSGIDYRKNISPSTTPPVRQGYETPRETTPQILRIITSPQKQTPLLNIRGGIAGGAKQIFIRPAAPNQPGTPIILTTRGAIFDNNGHPQLKRKLQQLTIDTGQPQKFTIISRKGMSNGSALVKQEPHRLLETRGKKICRLTPNTRLVPNLNQGGLLPSASPDFVHSQLLQIVAQKVSNQNGLLQSTQEAKATGPLSSVTQNQLQLGMLPFLSPGDVAASELSSADDIFKAFGIDT